MELSDDDRRVLEAEGRHCGDRTWAKRIAGEVGLVRRREGPVVSALRVLRGAGAVSAVYGGYALLIFSADATRAAAGGGGTLARMGIVAGPLLATVGAWAVWVLGGRLAEHLERRGDRPPPGQVVAILRRAAPGRLAAVGRSLVQAGVQAGVQAEVQTEDDPGAPAAAPATGFELGTSEWVARLRGGDWAQKLVAYDVLRRGGPGVVGELVEAARRGGPQARHWAGELVAELTEPVEGGGSWMCLHCFHRWELRRPRGLDDRFHHPACSSCGRTWPAAEVRPDRVTAVLDREAREPFTLERGVLRVFWPRHREPFDLDRVHVVDATDADVEAFAIACGNDPDVARRERYRSMPVEVEPGCALGPNARAILRRTFGAVAGGEP